jgi:hypothetical protein
MRLHPIYNLYYFLYYSVSRISIRPYIVVEQHAVSNVSYLKEKICQFDAFRLRNPLPLTSLRVLLSVFPLLSSRRHVIVKSALVEPGQLQ